MHQTGSENWPSMSAEQVPSVPSGPILYTSYNTDVLGRRTDDLFSRRSRRVLLLYVGGTIGMARSPAGVLEPCKGYLTQVVRGMGELQRRPEIAPFDIIEYDELLDSSDMRAHDYLRIAKDVARHHDEYDGFLVLHGTDTMHYTASALSFLLMNLAKPVIMTGSMVPFFEPYTDARRNMVIGLMLASNPTIREVCIFFNDCLLRGNCCTKLHHTFGAFCTPNCPPLGVVESTGFHLRKHLLLPQPCGPLRVLSDMRGNVVVFAMYADCDIKQLLQQLLGGEPHAPTPPATQEEIPTKNAEEQDGCGTRHDDAKQKDAAAAVGSCDQGRKSDTTITNPQPRKLIDAVLLEISGVGSTDSDVSLALRELAKVAKANDIVLCVTTLEPHGTLSSAEIGRLHKISPDLIYLYMTTAAAEMKLIYLFGKGLSPDTVRKMMPRNLRGESTPGDSFEANM
ncbi:cytoplasmic l-asparaginase i-like protein [Trypanosoma rangeli]|uniref:asparaginase n=1 Tax=Trypanosoma rangeli TaxID=5698 RepID=A0A422N3G9_TRYRA|nr:cytoplasmic l-asparaginase i-like protein [Trypanosoma rangeli]RNF00033.1 cytoplasmic l-asparaginase i-like protein [Trypanosoma rangeli]|eukprot:RNF00033.1 cytoplasmic l-asparaginase i-like protein [Trypanosoma rangeli]